MPSAMPVGIQDAGHLAELRRDQVDGLFGDPGRLNLNVQRPGSSPLSRDPPGQDVEILKALENPRQGAWVRIGRDTEVKNGPIVS